MTETAWPPLAQPLLALLEGVGQAVFFKDREFRYQSARELYLDLHHARLRLQAAGLRATTMWRPGETEIIGSNLDSAETARLLELAQQAFEREVRADRALRERARTSAERAIRGMLRTLGFTEVQFVEALGGGSA